MVIFEERVVFSLKYLENVNHLLDLLEEKSPSIYKHSERVAMMCYAFGKRFDLDGKEREKLYLAGFLHEIGKINFDDEITIEKKKMKLDDIYPLFSKAVVSSLGDYGKISEIVSQHLENIDGSGHPCGLNAEQIHLYATMVHMCDYYDTCRMEGNTHSAATAKLRKLVDVAFPKKMITPFIKMLISGEVELWDGKNI